MKASQTERDILAELCGCRYLPGSFDKKFPREVDPENMSPLQRWWIYKQGFKYRKQIGSIVLAAVCQKFLAENPDKPLSRKESEKMLKRAMKEAKQPKIDF